MPASVSPPPCSRISKLRVDSKLALEAVPLLLVLLLHGGSQRDVPLTMLSRIVRCSALTHAMRWEERTRVDWIAPARAAAEALPKLSPNKIAVGWTRGFEP